MHSSYLLN